jgi:hypothetical protein
VNGQGACDRRYTTLPTDLGQCVACTEDAGGCGSNELCVLNHNTNRLVCQFDCLVDAGVCGSGNYCADSGICKSGCSSSSDCVGNYQGFICANGQCVGCLTSADCPDYQPGCNPQSYGGVNTCGYCQSDLDCNGQHCETNASNVNYTNQCACHSDDECPLDAPVCLGLNTDAGFPAGSGRCGCATSNDCPNIQGVQFVCESRFPYTVRLGAYGLSIGGACIAPCNVDLSSSNLVPTDCSLAGISTYSPDVNYSWLIGPPQDYATVCEYSTGYCVQCADDSDCPASTDGPTLAPVCVKYPNGIDPSFNVPTGGGQCGCSDTSQCNGGYACSIWQWNRTCQPACTITSLNYGYCNQGEQIAGVQPNLPFCNTETGACVQCFDDYDCTGTGAQYSAYGIYLGAQFITPRCDTATGVCTGCTSDADCPSSTPNCTNGYCGYCATDSDCYQDAGFTCVRPYGSSYGGRCQIVGCVPDENENPTDAGASCPASMPFCGQSQICPAGRCMGLAICAQCRPDFQPPNYQLWGDCGPNGGCMWDGVCYQGN